jgi:cyclic pyranopterin phosphate synthase
VRSVIARHHALLDSTENSGGPARYVRLARHPGRIGFISPNSHNFCGSCNRDMTVEGQLLLCLGQDNAVDFRALLRRYPLDDGPLVAALRRGLQGKPLRHDFSGDGRCRWCGS